MFTIYMRRDGQAKEIGFLQQVIPITRKNPNTQQDEIFPVLSISWCSFKASTGEVGPTRPDSASCTFESPDDVICMGSEMVFFAKYDMYDEEEDEYADEDETDVPEQESLNV